MDLPTMHFSSAALPASAAAALARLLGADEASWSLHPVSYPLTLPSHNGLDGRCFLVTSGSGALVVKHYYPDAAIDTGAARDAWLRAGAAGLAPALLAADTADGWLITAFAGAGWRPAGGLDFDRAPCVAAALALLRTWHEEAPLGRTAPGPGVLATQVEAAVGARLAELTEAWPVLRTWVERIEQALIPGARRVPLHREVVPANFLVCGDAMQLIDFDHAADGDAYADLGALGLALCDLPSDYVALVAAYAGEASPSLVARTRLHAILEDFRWGAVALLRHAATDRPIADFLGYARMRLGRCLGHLGAWDAGTLISEVAR